MDGNEDDPPDCVYSTAHQTVKRNIDMDAAAKSFLKEPRIDYLTTNKARIFPCQQISFQLEGITVTGDLKNRIQFQQHANPSKQ